MANKHQQELISASIDGELTAQEQAAVDQLLASDLDAATLHEELRALSSTLQALPQRRVGQDLSSKVLSLAEREMQATPASVAQEKAVASGLSSGAGGFHWRKYTWAAMAVAAALVIMVVQSWNEQPEMSPVALAPQDDAREPSATFMAEAPVEEVEMTDALALQESSADAIATDAPGRVADHRLRKNEQAFGASKGASARSVQPQGRTLKKGGDRQSQTEFVAKGGQRGQRNGSQQKAVDKADERKDAVGALGLARGVDRDRVGAALQQLAQTSREINPQGVLVVQVDISPEAAKQGTFDQLLARNQIVFIEEESAAAAPAPAIAPKPSALTPSSSPAKPAGKEAAKPQAPPGQPVAEAQEALNLDGIAITATEDMVYVVASYDQIQQTLASLDAGRGQYLSIKVNPAPEVVSQRPLTAYSRAAQGRGRAQEREGIALPLQTTAPAANGSVDKSIGNKPSNRPEKKPASSGVKVQEKSKAVAQDAETAKLAKSLQSGYAQRIQAPGANFRRARTAGAGQQGISGKRISGKQSLTEPSENRSGANARPTAETSQTDSIQVENKADSKSGVSPTQTMRVLFVLRVVDSPRSKANQAPQADPAK